MRKTNTYDNRPACGFLDNHIYIYIFFKFDPTNEF